jgi:hypothetical protein
MKKIVIDEKTSKLLNKLAERSSRRRRSRTALVRAAPRRYAENERRRATEVKDGAIFRKHRKRLARQARALISEQARS